VIDKKKVVSDEEAKRLVAGTVSHAIRRDRRLKLCVREEREAFNRVKNQDDYEDMRNDLVNIVFGD